MRILQLGKFYPIHGGVEKVMYDLMTGLTTAYPEDVTCDMLCVAASPQPGIIKLNDHATLYCAKLDKKLFSTMLSSEIIYLVRKKCNDYDIIHIHHPDPMVALALKLSGYKGKIVLHWHSDILKQKLLLKFYRPLQNWLINRCDIIIGTSPKYLEESPHLRNYNKEKIAVPIGIDPIIPDSDKVKRLRNKYPGKKIIFSLGRLVGYKGYRYLIDSAKYLPDDFIILIGGSGPLNEELEDQISVNSLDAKVKLLGRVSEHDLPSYYGACDVYVMSSIWKTEAFGIVQIEAMSCGKPIVATHIPESGVDWVNKDGYSGINVEPENPKAIADAILSITYNSETYRQYCTNSKLRYEEIFTLKQMVTGVRKIYDLILNH